MSVSTPSQLQGIYQLFQSVRALPDAFWAELPQRIRVTRYPKRHRLLEPNEVCNEIHFLVSGMARAFYYDEGEEITAWLMKEGDIIISVVSFYTQRPSQEGIELLEAGEVVSLGYSDLQDLYDRYPDFNFVGRVLTERYYILSEERAYSLRMHTAQERYDLLLQSHPEVFQRVPLKHIASYLGMKAETLSRIRGKKG